MIMQKNNQVETMLDQMSVAFSDSEVKQEPVLRELILNLAKELNETQDTRLMASKIVKSLVSYYWETKKQLPQAAIILHNQVKKQATVYDGIATSAVMLPVWF